MYPSYSDVDEILCLFMCITDEKVDLVDSKWEDIHVITGALKMFFRELPEPLFTYSSFNDFVDAISKFTPLFLSIVICPIFTIEYNRNKHWINEC